MRDCVPLLPPHSRVSGKACARQLCRRRRGCTAAPCFFPEIASALCPAPCRGACREQGMDTPIDLPHWSAPRARLAPQRSENYYLPPKEQRIAVLGASLPGCAFAARMAEKQYLVTVFESSDRICPELDTQLSRSIIEADILPALQKGPCTLEFARPSTRTGTTSAHSTWSTSPPAQHIARNPKMSFVGAAERPSPRSRARSQTLRTRNGSCEPASRKRTRRSPYSSSLPQRKARGRSRRSTKPPRGRKLSAAKSATAPPVSTTASCFSSMVPVPSGSQTTSGSP